jgi:uncharacterized protein (DUF1015 family)
MARIYPFRALRYNPSLVRLQDVVTQPYDKITPAMQQAYYQRSPYNLVRIILGLPELFDGRGTQDVYRRAAEDFAAWRREGILAQESDVCIYAYSQTFRVASAGQDENTLCERRGFIALGELYDYSAKVVFRHEQTLSRPKGDRLSLLNATHAHFGQIFMLYSDPGLTASRLLFGSGAAPDIEVTDEYEVVHRAWRISDPGTINLMTTALEDKKLIIADGHHRYETALQYAREHGAVDIDCAGARHAGAALQPAPPEAAAMMTFVNMDEPGLVILPTHRVVHGLDGFSATSLVERLRGWFTVEAVTSQDPAGLMAQLSTKAGNAAFVAVTADGSFLLTAIPGAAESLLAEVPERQRNLGTVQLHRVVLERALGISPEAIAQQSNVRYLRDAAEAVEQVLRNEANVAFLMNPLTLDELREVAFAGEVLPQKSTDFFPKLLSGLTIYAME